MEIIGKDELNKLLQKEDEVRKQYALAYETFVTYLKKSLGQKWSSNDLDLESKSHCMMGSMADGCFSARFFAEKEFEFECDILLDLVSLPEWLVERHPTRPGVCIITDQTPFLNVAGVGQHMFHNFDTMSMVHGIYDSGRMQNTKAPNTLLNDIIKSLDNDWNVGKKLDLRKDIFTILSEVIANKPFDTQCDVETSYNGPALTKTFRIIQLNTNKVSFHVDFVLGARIKYNVWPAEAQEWQHRMRWFPSFELVEKIVRDCVVHLVAKPIQDQQQKTSDTEWRLTFYGERDIVKAQSLAMRQTYYVFKIIFYRFFKTPVNGISLSSYLAKTTMFWLTEEMHEGEWTYFTIFNNVQLLLVRLFKFLDDGVLPHYFVSSINLLANVPKELLDKVRGLHRKFLIEYPYAAISLTNSEAQELIEKGYNVYIEQHPINFLHLTQTVSERIDTVHQICKCWITYYKKKNR